MEQDNFLFHVLQVLLIICSFNIYKQEKIIDIRCINHVLSKVIIKFCCEKIWHYYIFRGSYLLIKQGIAKSLWYYLTTGKQGENFLNLWFFLSVFEKCKWTRKKKSFCWNINWPENLIYYFIFFLFYFYHFEFFTSKL